ncbi:MAG: ADP-forming succinate--CoA ligase subunit beta [Armatimonadetes bacterium]|nr:ADP-forming succinate--CoA ligase subunit beta [Armatimonadota bacterium]
MFLLEYLAKGILRKSGISISKGGLAEKLNQAQNIAQKLKFPLILKAQVLSGGRGKLGAIKKADNLILLKEEFSALLGMKLADETVNKILIEEAQNILQEFYLSIVLDRVCAKYCLIFSPSGGMEIEEIAEKFPKNLFKVYLDPFLGLQDYQINQIIFNFHLPNQIQKPLRKIILTLNQIIKDYEAVLVEINPLALIKNGSFMALDAKIDLDENAFFRHSELLKLKIKAESDKLERKAREKNLAYVKLNGDIGIIGNGAGLVMATLDAVNMAGGHPANFLDLGGGAKEDLVKEALELILKDRKIKGIFFNIFGGITRCDEVARGIIKASGILKMKKPIVIRLSGTNESLGKELLKEAHFYPVDTMFEGAKKIVELVNC